MLIARCQSEGNMLVAEEKHIYMHRKGQQLQTVVELGEGNIIEGLTTEKVVPQVPGGKDETVSTIP